MFKNVLFSDLIILDKLYVNQLAFSPNGKILASIGYEWAIYLWDVSQDE